MNKVLFLLLFLTTNVFAQYQTGLVIPNDWQLDVVWAPPSTVAALPARWDWREHATLMPIRNQGNCSSCWAFSSVAAMEDAMRIGKASPVDLSEQYLVSCNKQGWSCNGGYFAHDYHVSPGAALEADFPYTASNSSCKVTSHPHHLMKWFYLVGADSVPSVDEIKKAIYEHGPISVAVAASNSFMGYRSGIYGNNDSSSINHAVNIIGWDDNGGYWIMRNSWGTAWGENGFMRIKYGSNKIGYGANYVVYNSSPTPPPPPCQPLPKADGGPDKVKKLWHSNPVIGTPAIAGQTYKWFNGAGAQVGYTAQIQVGPGTYYLQVSTACGTATDSVTVKSSWLPF